MKADVVVVGAGPAGSVMARRLAEAGADVVLLEAGSAAASPRAGLLDVGPDSRVITRHPARLGGVAVELPRGSTLGGSGAVNGGYCTPARPGDLAAWGDDWPRRYAVGLARAAERLRPGLAPMGPVATRVAAAFPGRMAAIAQARRGDRRVTAFEAWDPPGAGVRVRTGARVERVRWRGGVVGGRCDGVVLAAGVGPGPSGRDDHDRDDHDRGGHYRSDHDRDDDDTARGLGTEIAAREVVLCTGTIGTAAILTASGLGPSTGHPVGDRVQEHPEVLLDLPADFAADAGGAGAAPGPSGPGGTAAVLVDPEHATAGATTPLPPLLSHVARLEPAPGAEVEVRPYAVPMHEVISGAAPSPLRLGIALMNPAGTGRILPDGTVLLPDDPRDAAVLGAAAELVAGRLGLDSPTPLRSTSQHLSGSARVGEVVDASGRVLGASGLRVADASVLPHLPRCGPYYTVLAVAEALAAEVVAEASW